MIVNSRSMHAFTICAISSSWSGLITTNGYSTLQSVASVTWDTLAKPSNWILSFLVIFFSLEKIFLLSFLTNLKSLSKVLTALLAASASSITFAFPELLSSMEWMRWFIASTNALSRFGFSKRSSWRYGFLLTTHKSPKTSKSIRADRPVFLSSLNSFKMFQIFSPRNRMTISRSENEV